VFQFHNGSIKAKRKITVGEIGEGFQFHNGSIKASNSHGRGVFDLLFQFHNGSIKAWYWLGKVGIYGIVSIPQWFD